jgi:hypothetical protein
VKLNNNNNNKSGPLTHSQSHQAQNTAEHTVVKQRKACTKEEISDMVLYVLQTALYRTLQDIV